MPSYLQKRRLRWYAVLEIPEALRPAFGNKPRFVRSLETDSRTVAQRRAMPIVAGWQKEIAGARNDPHDDAAFWARSLRLAKSDKERESIIEEIETAAWRIGAVNVEHVGTAPSGDPGAQRFYAAATGALVKTTEHLDEWLTTSRASAKTQDMQKADVTRFAKEFPLVSDINRPDVRRWVTRLMNDGKAKLSPATVQRILSALRGYWRYLQSISVAAEDAEPFNKLDVARQNQQAEPRTKRKPFEPASVLKLHKAAIVDDDGELADLISLGMWTGCRIEELCALKVDQVKGKSFTVGEAKTEAGWRDVPIHPKLAPTMKRLIGKRKDGFVLAGLTENKYGDRSNAIGKRFGRLKKNLGFGGQYVFHSIRKTVITILENAGIPENVVADIAGHEKPTMTYGLYSGGVSLAVKATALARLRYT